MQLVLNHILKKENFSLCKLEKIYYKTKQQYLIKNQKIHLTNPAKADYLTRQCPGIDNVTEIVATGFNMYPARRGCHYETSELTIYIGDDPTILNNQEDEEDEITLIKNIDKTEDLLGPGYTPSEEADVLHNLILKYKNDSKLNGKAITQLEQEMKQLDSIQNVANYNPLKIDLLNPKHIGNWITGILWFCSIFIIFMILNCIDWIIPGSLKKAIKWIYGKCKQSCKQQCSIRTSNTNRTVQYRPVVPGDYSAHIPLVEQRTNPEILIFDQMESLTGQDTSEEAETDFSRVFPNLTKNPDNKRELPWHYTENDVGELCLTSYIQAGGTYIPVYYDFLDGKIKDNNRGIYPNEKTPSTNIIRDYLAEVEDRPLPELAKDNAGALCFRSDPLIKFTKDNYWINKVNN